MPSSTTLMRFGHGMASPALKPLGAVPPTTAHAMVPGGTAATYQGGVMAGPLYNGQDYLGDDPDPNIRSYLLRDLTGRYGGSR